MTRGAAAPDDLELEWQGEGFPDTLAQLRAIEARAFERSGRIDELRREVGIEDEDEAPAAPTTKDKIVSKLKDKAGPRTATAPRARQAKARVGSTAGKKRK